jgi:S1-C subfamily serine protease
MSTSNLVALSNHMADLVAAMGPSVVQVHGRRRPASGIAFSSEAIVTTTRALGREDGLRITTHDGRTIDAELAGWDPATGLAVLKAAGVGVTPPTVADGPARVGHLGIAIARSWSNAVTASAGIVAVIGGPLRTGRGRAIEQVIRTTAPMHDGFAGGAFIDASGQLIGVATAAAIRGLGVIVPASIAWKTAADVLQHGSPRRGFLGIAGQPVALAPRQRGSTGRERALLIIGVTADSPADAAGLLVGDVLVDFDGQPVQSPEELLELLTGGRVGQRVTIRVLRAGNALEISVTVGDRPA